MADKRKKKTSDAVAILHRRFVDGQPEMQQLLEEARSEAAIGRKIYALREAHGLSQRELAEIVGTTASSICRLENADYEGHSLPMLRKIAAALGQRVEVRFIPADDTLVETN